MVGHEVCPCGMDGALAMAPGPLPSSAPPHMGVLHCRSLASLAHSQLKWVCVLMNSFLCTSQHSLGVDSCCCQLCPRATSAKAGPEESWAPIFPAGRSGSLQGTTQKAQLDQGQGSPKHLCAHGELCYGCTCGCSLLDTLFSCSSVFRWR